MEAFLTVTRRQLRRRVAVGYTLVELLVTIAIVAILLAVIVPQLRRAKEAAERAQCMQNQRGNGLATLEYAVENQGRFPRFFFAFSPGNSGNIVILVKPKKARDAGIDGFDRDRFVCPSDEYRDTVPLEDDSGRVAPLPMSYGYNIALPLEDARLTTIESPAETVVMYDGTMSGDGARGRNIQGRYRGPDEFAQTASMARHHRKINALFADWHVEPIETIEPVMVDPGPRGRGRGGGRGRGPGSGGR